MSAVLSESSEKTQVSHSQMSQERRKDLQRRSSQPTP